MTTIKIDIEGLYNSFLLLQETPLNRSYLTISLDGKNEIHLSFNEKELISFLKSFSKLEKLLILK